MSPTLIFYSALALLLIALFLFWLASRRRKESGLPGGRVVYTDMRTWGEVAQPFYDPVLNLTGRPDYLVEQNGHIIPVEVKSGRTPYAPYDAHIFQLAAYCLLVQRTMGKRPPYGIIHYPGRDFAVDYTTELESELLDVLADVRLDEHRISVDRSHDEMQRCLRCGYRQVCDQGLG